VCSHTLPSTRQQKRIFCFQKQPSTEISEYIYCKCNLFNVEVLWFWRNRRMQFLELTSENETQIPNEFHIILLLLWKTNFIIGKWGQFSSAHKRIIALCSMLWNFITMKLYTRFKDVSLCVKYGRFQASQRFILFIGLYIPLLVKSRQLTSDNKLIFVKENLYNMTYGTWSQKLLNFQKLLK
jgi:hypothetical protein